MMKLSIALSVAWRLYGTPYIWGGDDPMKGLDCSGTVIEILQSVGKLPHGGDWTAQGLYSLFKGKASQCPCTGCLVFYGNSVGHITHVMFSITEGLVLGATGGDSKTTTVEAAIRQNAFVKVRPTNYRNDIVAVVNPFKED